MTAAKPSPFPNEVLNRDAADPMTATPPRSLPADDVVCWLCGGPVTRRHCKIICRNCGFTRDCSDP
ncbi:MAG: hypothetical protein RMN24_00380 [Anaerolineae bacterium]|nr:hypothetical protein [Caldilineales bacterium]MDW8267594.1 hypothetical protein [Anaerolineae bacterium]